MLWNWLNRLIAPAPLPPSPRGDAIWGRAAPGTRPRLFLDQMRKVCQSHVVAFVWASVLPKGTW